ncbi:methyltransferase domain-containing protein [Phycicoccus sonneratiae]|uniref:Methyltransferase domain-containing protein n=1 Tax=Phycicoccus sonneratiae TaxID=2807628 RepID=A0ABS2CIH4_9MICO|nr:methyltransferase domain-containing protein [Phycicoccus sonneraticus]MBM6399677.1 methyltransferase domain-containing protein [Phycicoccus sonneraticus]
MQCDDFDAGRCRSCTLMGSPYDTQLADKERRVREVLAAHAGALQWSPPVRSPASHFRNKAKLVVGGRAGRPTLGILDERGRGVDLRRCGLYEPGLAATFDPLHRVLAELGIEPYDVPARRGELKHVIVTHSPDGEQLVRFVVRSEAGLSAVRSALPAVRAAVPSARVVTVNVHPEHKAVLEGETEVVLTDEGLLPMRLGEVTLHLGPRAFFQTNTWVARELYAQARRWADTLEPSVVTDLYCGVGGFALHLATPGRRVVGVETSEEAVAAARTSAREMASRTVGLDITFRAGDATRELADDPGLVVVNPPRRGIGPDLAARLEASPASHVVYSSCNVDTLARDLGAMPGLRPVEGRVVDMFPQTRHVETVLLLARR